MLPLTHNNIGRSPPQASARWPLITEVILVLCAISSLGRFLAVSGPRNGARGDGEGDDDRPARMGDRYVPGKARA